MFVNFDIFIELRAELTKCLTEQIPVLMVVAVLGSTEESAIDPLSEICDMREEFANKVRIFR